MPIKIQTEHYPTQRSTLPTITCAYPSDVTVTVSSAELKSPENRSEPRQVHLLWHLNEWKRNDGAQRIRECYIFGLYSKQIQKSVIRNIIAAEAI